MRNSDVPGSIRNSVIELLSREGRTLSSIGVNDWALTRDQALVIISEFDAMNVAILGGDVFEDKEGRIAHTYENWYCDRRLDETDEAYRIRANEKARAYIRDYPISSHLFTLVVNES
ncbi:MAG: hypothetical protein KA175_07050 [Flavobacteriales bacterium]|nr:hypothetical protein [Flavobacteriales bacterium]MBP6697357.1 hypothetical protein [Flavobacteriales bacterium]